MATASIVIAQAANSAPGGYNYGSRTDLDTSGLVTLTNYNDDGVTSWLWTLVSKPVGSATVLSSASLSSTTFTPDTEGSYLIELTVNERIKIREIGSVLTVNSIRFLADGERDEIGWTNTVNDNFSTVETIAVGAGSVHDIAGVLHGASTLTQLNTKVSDATLIDTTDARLSDSRTPSAHNLGGSAHGADTLANLNTKVNDATLIDTTDARLSDTRTPTSHATSHNAGGGDALAIDAVAGTGSLRTLGTTATSACAGNDSRLSDARTPSAHAASHFMGDGDSGPGSDPLTIATDDGSLTPSLRTLGTGDQQACAGSDSRLSDSRTDNDAIHDNVSAEVSLVTIKSVLVDEDLLLLEDSADGYSKKRVRISDLPGGTDSDAIHDDVSAEFSLVTLKSSPVYEDLLLLEDSADGYSKKRVRISDLPFSSIDRLLIFSDDTEFTETSGSAVTKKTFRLVNDSDNPVLYYRLVVGIWGASGDTARCDFVVDTTATGFVTTTAASEEINVIEVAATATEDAFMEVNIQLSRSVGSTDTVHLKYTDVYAVY